MPVGAKCFIWTECEVNSHKDPIGRCHFYPPYFTNDETEMNEFEEPLQHSPADKGQSKT